MEIVKKFITALKDDAFLKREVKDSLMKNVLKRISYLKKMKKGRKISNNKCINEEVDHVCKNICK